MDNNQAELTAMKGALLETTASRGWRYVTRFAETVVRDMEKAALAEDDDQKANGLRRDARGARKFMDDLLRRIEIAQSIDAPQDDDFLEVATG